MNSTIFSLEYQGCGVSILSGSAYVNLTEMCSRFRKLPKDFLRLPSTIAFMAALARETGLPTRWDEKLGENLLVSRDAPALVLTTDGRHGGTWAHPLLAVECARWLSPAFAIWCNQTVLRIMQGEVIHPAADRAEKLRRESAIARLKQETEAAVDRHWDIMAIDGQCSIRAYLLAVGAVPEKGLCMSLGARLKHRARIYGYVVGRIRQRRARSGRNTKLNCSGWQEVATFPPEEIHAEALRMGLIDSDRIETVPRTVWGPFQAMLLRRVHNDLPELPAFAQSKPKIEPLALQVVWTNEGGFQSQSLGTA